MVNLTQDMEQDQLHQEGSHWMINEVNPEELWTIDNNMLDTEIEPREE